MRPKSQPLPSVIAEVQAFRAEFEIEPYDKPLTRGDCIDGPRPCPYVTCPHHLGYEITPNGGLFKRVADSELGVAHESCALDVADRGGATLEEVAGMMSITRERVRQIEEKALDKIRALSEDGRGGELPGFDRDSLWAITRARSVGAG